MATRELRYSIYAGTFDALRSAVETRDIDRLLFIYNSVARLPDDEQSAARLAMKHVTVTSEKCSRDEFCRESSAA